MEMTPKRGAGLANLRVAGRSWEGAVIFGSRRILAGLAAGFKALEGRVAAAYASSCDVPLLTAGFIEFMVAALNGSA